MILWNLKTKNPYESQFQIKVGTLLEFVRGSEKKGARSLHQKPKPWSMNKRRTLPFSFNAHRK